MRFLKAQHLYQLVQLSAKSRPLSNGISSGCILARANQASFSAKAGTPATSHEKKTKSVQLTSRITPHDLQTKVKKAADMVQKGHLTRIVIKNMNPSDTKTPANLFKEFTSACEEFAVVKQSQSSPNELVFTLKPKTSLNEDTKQQELKPAQLHQHKGATKTETEPS